MISWHNDPNGYDDDADTSASWAVHEWTDAVLSVTDSQSVVHRRLVAGNSINSVTLYGHEGLLPETLQGASYSLAFDNRVMTLYDRDAEPRDHFATYDDAVYAMLTNWAELPLPQSGADQVRNGDFAPEAVDRLGWDNDRPHGWYVNHLIPHATGTGPLQKRRVIENGEDSYLHLYTKAAKYGTSGISLKGNPANGLYSEVLQVIDATPGMLPVLNMDFMIPAAEYKPTGVNFYIAICGMNSTLSSVDTAVIYTFGKTGFWPWDHIEEYTHKIQILENPDLDQWYRTGYNLDSFKVGLDFNTNKIDPEYPDWQDLGIDRIVLLIGVANFNYYASLSGQVPLEIGVIVDNISIEWMEHSVGGERYESRKRVPPSAQNVVLDGTRTPWSLETGYDEFFEEMTISWDPIPDFDIQDASKYYQIDFFYIEGGMENFYYFSKRVDDATSSILNINDPEFEPLGFTPTGYLFVLYGVDVKQSGVHYTSEKTLPYWFRLIHEK